MHVPHFSDPGGPIRKADLLAALADLRDGQPFIYAFLRQIPIEEFCILVDDNARERTERVTVDRFCARYARYDPTDAFFVVRYHTYVYDKPERKKREYPFTGEEIGVCLRRSDLSDLKDRFTDILRYQLRKAILANRPFRLTDEVCREYGFRAEECEQFRALVDRENRQLVEKLRGEYSRLAAIDCLQEPTGRE